MEKSKLHRYFITISCLSVATFIAFKNPEKVYLNAKQQEIKIEDDEVEPEESNINDGPESDIASPESDSFEGKKSTNVSIEENIEEENYPKEEVLTLTLERGSNLSDLLRNAGFSRSVSAKISRKLGKVVNLRALRSGQEFIIDLTKDKDGSEPKLNSLTFQANQTTCVALTCDINGKYKASKQNIKLTKELVCIEGKVNGSFYQSAFKDGVPGNIIKNSTQALSHGVNFKHGIKENDPYQVVYEVQKNEKGQVVRVGELKYIAISVKGKFYQVYNYKSSRGSSNYYTSTGESIMRSQFKLPISNSVKKRISSKYGYRIHPIKKRRVFHKGVDYAVRYGTPIIAAASGYVEMSKWHGGYGRCILIRHDNGFKTRYAHLSKYKVRSGQYVNQGQVIGLVGTSGSSTGAHLHFEVIKNGRLKNPLSVKYVSSNKLTGRDLSGFNKYKRSIHTQVAMANYKKP